MEMSSFIESYFEDKKNEFKEKSIRNKQHMMEKHIVPYFRTRKMNEITSAEVIQCQNIIQEKGYSKTYEGMIHNQLNELFNYDEKNGLRYTLHRDYYFPDLEINEEEPTYGKYGIMRKQFLKEY